MDSASVNTITVSGHAHVYIALDIGFSVDLRQCAGLIHESREASGFRHHAPTPPCLNVQPLPLRISQSMTPIQGRTFHSDETVALTVYDFGAVSVEYLIPFQATLEQLAEISSELYDSPLFVADARARAAALLEAIQSAVRRPQLRAEAEDYLIFAIPQLGETPGDLDRLVADHGPQLAQILSSNTRELAEQQLREELSGRIAYFPDDLTIITWNTALVFGMHMDDVLTVLELANVQLRELHYLDDQLDGSLQDTYEMNTSSASVKARMRRIGELMLDGQAFSEAVTNAFKPFPDAFLARVYAMASQSLGLHHFNQSIKDKLNLLNTLYTILSDEAAHARSTRLEWIVIILIFIEIVMGLWERLWPLVHGS
jgi:hypothetical protein